MTVHQRDDDAAGEAAVLDAEVVGAVVGIAQTVATGIPAHKRRPSH